MLKIKIRGLKEELEARIYIFVKVEYGFLGGKLNMGKKETSKTTKQHQMKMSVQKQRDFILSLKISSKSDENNSV